MSAAISTMPTASEIRERLGARGTSVKCPAHKDDTASLSVSDGRAGKTLLKCHAGCSQTAVIEALQEKGIWPKATGIGLTVHDVAAAKNLPYALLVESGFFDDEIRGRPVVRIEYRDSDGNVTCVRYRGSVDNGAGPRFWFKKGDRQQLFGLWRLRSEDVIVVEGETDAVALWSQNYNAIGVPGADAWHDDRFAQQLANCPVVNVHIEPDSGGEKFRAAFERSSLRDRVRFFTVPGAKDPCELHSRDADGFCEKLETAIANARPATAAAATEPQVKTQPHQIPFRLLCDILANPHVPTWLLRQILEMAVIALIVGRRGSYKSFIALDWMMQAAVSGYPVLMISPEGAGLSNRIAAWLQHHGGDVDPKLLKICIIEVRVDLTDPGVLDSLHNTVTAWGETPAAILVDTVSKNSGRMEENSNSETKVFIGCLDTQLRARYGATVLAVHHTGHDNQSRARGASAFEADVEALYIVTREGVSKTVTVSRERFKDSEELPPLAYEATVIDLGRIDDDGQPITSLALNRVDAPPVAAKSKGPNQTKAMTALREWMRNHPDSQNITSPDMAALLKAHGINRQRRPEVLNFLVNARILTPSIGGHTLDRSML